MAIWSTVKIRSIECGASCRECGEVITDNPEGEPITCEECNYEMTQEKLDGQDFDNWLDLNRD